jgi:hypothetical protein
MFREAEDYADGWAKAVHCAQPQTVATLSEKPSVFRPAQDLGIRIVWDDEQVTKWADRSIDRPKAAYDNCPMGIHGYRVDVLDVSLGQWFSLSQVKGDFGTGSTAFGHITGELGVEVHPATPMDVIEDRSYWLPIYFTNWAQTSLVGTDETTMKLWVASSLRLQCHHQSSPKSASSTRACAFDMGKSTNFACDLWTTPGRRTSASVSFGHPRT